MVSENLKEWIKEKREQGVSDERIKKSLEKTGHDPSIVDELDNPFDADNSDIEPSEDLFNSEDQGSNSVKPSNQEDGEEETASEKAEEKEESSVGLPNTPSFSLPSAPDFSRKKLGAVAVLLVLVVGGAGVYSFVYSGSGTGLDFSNIPGSNLVTSNGIADLNRLDEKYSGCPDAGVRIKTVSGSDGVTTADVLVTRNEAQVVLEVIRDGEVIGFSSESLKGEASMTVDAVGDTVRLRPAGCKQFRSQTTY